jgi:hypothetical protein
MKPSPPREFVLREVHTLDLAGGFTGPVDVHVDSGRIARIGPRLRADGAPSLDFSRRRTPTLSPAHRRSRTREGPVGRVNRL